DRRLRAHRLDEDARPRRIVGGHGQEGRAAVGHGLCQCRQDPCDLPAGRDGQYMQIADGWHCRGTLPNRGVDEPSIYRGQVWWERIGGKEAELDVLVAPT